MACILVCSKWADGALRHRLVWLVPPSWAVDAITGIVAARDVDVLARDTVDAVLRRIAARDVDVLARDTVNAVINSVASDCRGILANHTKDTVLLLVGTVRTIKTGARDPVLARNAVDARRGFKVAFCYGIFASVA